MRIIFIFISFLIPTLAIAQKINKEKNLVRVLPATIFINRDSIEFEITQGKLAYLKDCEWDEIIIVNGSSITQTHKDLQILHHRKKGKNIVLQKIRKKKPDGTYRFLQPVEIIFTGYSGK